MENQKVIEKKKSAKREKKKEGGSLGASVFSRAKRGVIKESLISLGFSLFALALSQREMIFETNPLPFSLLAATCRQTPFVFLGVALGCFGDGFDYVRLIGALATVLLRIFSRFFLDKDEKLAQTVKSDGILKALPLIFSEHPYLRMMSGAVGVFVVGIVRIASGGFRFYDLFAAIFYLVMTPLSTMIFSKYFDIAEQKRREGRAFSISQSRERMRDLSLCLLVCALVFSLEGASVIGVSIPIFISVAVTLYACKRGALYGVIAGLLLGFSLSPKYAPMCAFCAIAYSSLSRISLFGASVASCISGLVWCVYVGGFSSLAEIFPSLLCSTMLFCTAERVDVFSDLERLLSPRAEESERVSIGAILQEKRALDQEEKLRALSDSFSNLSEIFYNLSSKLKRPSVLDLRTICERSFEDVCERCENRDLCFGAEYGATLDVMKKITVQLHSTGLADEKKLPESFKKRCVGASELIGNVNRACSVATRKALHNEKTEIIALDYDAISHILNDAIAENEEEFRSDPAMSKRIGKVISDEGYGDHSVVVYGKRKLKIVARGLDPDEHASDVGALHKRLEEACGMSLVEPTFELSLGSVNMMTEARRAYSCEAAFSTSASVGESVCGDTVSIFENKNDYLYALISDGMGTGRSAAGTSEMCNVFLRNMLDAGNRMETSLRMLNSVIRAKGGRSESECSATVDLLQFDLYSGALTLVKSGAAPTFVIRRGNVFKLASPSFPIGILKALDAKQIDISCEDGDLIIMVSDGATRQGEDCSYLLEMLKDQRLVSESPSRIAEKLIKRAKAESETGNDDVSIVVLRVKKELCVW